MYYNNTWFDTLQEAIDGTDAGLYGDAQEYRPGETVQPRQ